MFLQYHFLVGLIVSLLLYPVYGFNVLIIFFANLLIDIDHYIFYIFKFKSFNVFKARKYFIEREKSTLLFFHTAEFLLVLLLFSFYYQFAFFALVGVVAHFLLDIYDELRENHIGRFPSMIWYLHRKK